MSIQNKTALIIGASGLVGNELLQILLNASEYDKITIFTRTKMNIEHSKLKQVIIDFNNLQNYKEHMRVHDVYCCLGTTIKKAGSQSSFRKVDYEYPLKLAQLAVECHVEKFLIITAMGSNRSSKIFYNRVKGEVEDDLKSVNLHSLHIFQPSLLLGDRKEFRLGEKTATLLTPIFSLVMVGPLRKYKPIHARNVALAMYRTGQNRVKGTYVYPSDKIQDISNAS